MSEICATCRRGIFKNNILAKYMPPIIDVPPALNLLPGAAEQGELGHHAPPPHFF